jgi:hypothetical protein
LLSGLLSWMSCSAASSARSSPSSFGSSSMWPRIWFVFKKLIWPII